MMPGQTWTLRRSRIPDLPAALLLAAAGVAALYDGTGWLWWFGGIGLAVGAAGLVVALRRDSETLRVSLGDQVRVEQVRPE
jgi:hypothetical protein